MSQFEWDKIKADLVARDIAAALKDARFAELEREIVSVREALSDTVEMQQTTSIQLGMAERENGRLSALIPVWVPVSERQPDGHEFVLTFHPSWGVDVRRCGRGLPLEVGLVGESATHWMPLPSWPGQAQEKKS